MGLPSFWKCIRGAGFYTLSEYILKRRATLVENVASSSLLKLCQDTPRPDGLKNRLFWWDESPVKKRKALEEIRN
jgi:hypothetical protein